MMATERQTSGRGTACQNLPGLAMAAPALPSTDDIRDELSRERYRSRFLGTFWNTVFVLVVVAAAAVLVAVLLLPAVGNYCLSDALSGGGTVPWSYVGLAALATAPAVLLFLLLGVFLMDRHELS